jgi:hypothetical protein
MLEVITISTDNPEIIWVMRASATFCFGMIYRSIGRNQIDLAEEASPSLPVKNFSQILRLAYIVEIRKPHLADRYS